MVDYLTQHQPLKEHDMRKIITALTLSALVALPAVAHHARPAGSTWAGSTWAGHSALR